MAQRERNLLLLGLLLAGAALGAAYLFGQGEVDSPEAPPPPPPVDGVRRSRDLPGLRIPGGLPPEGADLLRKAWETVGTGTDAEAARTLRDLAAPARADLFRGHHAAVLGALAPGLERLILRREGPVPGAAMEAAAALAKAGGKEGRTALEESGIVDGALGVQAGSGPPDLRLAAIRLLGVVGGDGAVKWLVHMTRDRDAAVAEKAVTALGEAWQQGGGRLPREAVTRVVELLGEPGTPPAVRRACVRTADRGWRSFEPYGVVEPVAAALASPDRALRAEAAAFFQAHPAGAASGAVVAALDREGDARIVEMLADAVKALAPADPSVLEVLARCRERTADPAALRSLDAAVAAVRRATR